MKLHIYSGQIPSHLTPDAASAQELFFIGSCCLHCIDFASMFRTELQKWMWKGCLIDRVVIRKKEIGKMVYLIESTFEINIKTSNISTFEITHSGYQLPLTIKISSVK